MQVIVSFNVDVKSLREEHGLCFLVGQKKYLPQFLHLPLNLIELNVSHPIALLPADPEASPPFQTAGQRDLKMCQRGHDKSIEGSASQALSMTHLEQSMRGRRY